ncbi:MAG: NUDIX hydrolase [Actinomycetes bacterium]
MSGAAKRRWDARSVALPEWVRGIEEVLPSVRPGQLSRLRPPVDATTRPAAVLMLFSGVARQDGDVLLIERASTLRSHPGQAAFPGGALDPDDRTAEDAALREAEEETGLRPKDVLVLGTLPSLWVPVSGFSVTPVVAWMPEPAPVRVRDAAEVARVQWLRLDALLDPRHRFSTRHPSGYVGPAFDVDGMFVWGFTAGLLSRLLDVAGLTVPWDATRLEPLPERYLAPAPARQRIEDESGVEP